MEYSYKRATSQTFVETVRAVERSIRAHGFSVEHCHDMQATLASKGFDIEPLRIYEITNERRLPPAIGPAERDRRRISLLMPCRVNVFMENTEVMVAVVRPSVMCRVFPEEMLDDVAAAVEAVVVELVDEAVA